MMKNRIAIIAVAYNRIHSLGRLLSSLDSAYYESDEVNLIISIDKSNTDTVESFADQFIWNHGEKIVDKHTTNLGLRNHMMSLGKWFEYYDSIIVLEDDIIVAPSFYLFAKNAVEVYCNDERIAGISLYNFGVNYQTSNPFVPIKDCSDVYFMKIAMSWGEVWMKKSWLSFYEWYENNKVFSYECNIPVVLSKWGNQSWLKYHSKYCIVEDKYFVYPYYSLTTNGCDVGTHAKYSSTASQVPIMIGEKKLFILPQLSTNSIRYDGFYENELLYEIIGYNRSELCVDLNGQKTLNGQRYWLTMKVKDFEIVKSFGLSYRPIEMNIINSVEGKEIYLYDTSIVRKNRQRKKNKELLHPRYLDEIAYLMIHYGAINIIKDFLTIIRRKL